MTRNNRRRSLLLAALMPATLAAGCNGTRNRGLESVHQPVVSRADYAVDLATRGDDLATGEAQRLSGWLTGLRVGYGDRVAVDDPAAAPATHDRVAGIVADYGLLLADTPPVTPTAVTPGTVRVVVSRMSAAVPHCPDWSRTSGTDFNQNTWSNYGCGVNTNLAAMVANPADLVRGAADTGPDGATSYKAIDLYRKAVPSGNGGTLAKVESAKGGK
ncbi:MAG: pilus assembly protein CpaD [Methylobacterium sp.]|nr:MAG: pilus assembly protein CpaD [Methylobacterium sp.]